MMSRIQYRWSSHPYVTLHLNLCAAKVLQLELRQTVSVLDALPIIWLLGNHCWIAITMSRWNDFELTTLPALVPLLSTESFESFHIDTDSEHLVSHVLPLLLRAYNDNDVRIQEEVLKRSTSVAKQLDGQVVKIHNRDHSGGKDSEASKEEGTCV
ncbi:uncharacterized protein LOC106377157 isoform X1 [Brassica napus]|uniref:uncharacterized protein LOC106377157 isoform X1 n=1 Tax=Brassica napus TaxID=3708 RepID=UPI000BBF2EFA|nr:uncharacterized protein LOC106377157 isoform X1 [Brassica napus]XP_022567760.1 uncharacterized protein LOC106377157 isoform X1 [Brassica napus]